MRCRRSASSPVQIRSLSAIHCSPRAIPRTPPIGSCLAGWDCRRSKVDAMSHEVIKNNIKVCMFDQYGTVVDMQGGLVAIATPFLKAKGWGGDPNAFVTWWRRTHFENSMIDAL